MSPYVITSLCVGVCDTGCVEVCPVDCIEGPLGNDALKKMTGAERAQTKIQLYIDPEECIFCGACEAACPALAIFLLEEVPEAHRASIEENKRFFLKR
jgi:ferredoxin